MKKISLFMLIALFFITNIYSSIELVTVPKKEDVQLTIYNSADITLVKEKRILTFKKGLNKIQFAWAHTLIDPTSLRLSFIENKKNFELLDTMYPANRKDVLQWNIVSKREVSSKIEISYFTSGITWKADYIAIADSNDKKINLTGYIKIINRSGENYPNASVRLIVGSIHLVEKIENLAKGVTYRDLPKEEKAYARRRYKKMVKRAERLNAVENGSSSYSSKKIVKEGLSEYFIFTIPGKETIPNKWEKKLLSVKATNISVNTIYRFNYYTTSSAQKYYEFRNKKTKSIFSDAGFGKTPLPNGKVYVYQKQFLKNKKSLKYINSFVLKYVAINDKIKLKAGYSNKVILIRKLKNYKRKKILVKNDFYRNPYVDSYIEEYSYEDKIMNLTNKRIQVEVERNFYGNFKIYDNNIKLYKKSKKQIQFFPSVSAQSYFILKYKKDVYHGEKYKRLFKK